MRHRTVEGVGINDATYPVGKGKCPYYQVWLSMLQRCYSARCQKNWPNYIGCSVVEDWHLFSKFKSWMEVQDWQNKVLDKDILVPGNKIYGPHACIFVSQSINTLLNNQPNKQGKYSTGVQEYRPGKYRASFRKNKIHQHIGVFDCPNEAAIAYKNAKADWVMEVAAEQSDLRLKNALYAAAKSIRGL